MKKTTYTRMSSGLRGDSGAPDSIQIPSLPSVQSFFEFHRPDAASGRSELDQLDQLDQIQKLTKRLQKREVDQLNQLDQRFFFISARRRFLDQADETGISRDGNGGKKMMKTARNRMSSERGVRRNQRVCQLCLFSDMHANVAQICFVEKMERAFMG